MRTFSICRSFCPSSPTQNSGNRHFLCSHSRRPEYRSMDGAPQQGAVFTLALQYPVPKPVSFSYDDCYLSMSGSTARLRVRLFEGELRFFYDGSPKDYYYLLRRISQFTRVLHPPSTKNTACRRTLPTATAKICHLSSAV